MFSHDENILYSILTITDKRMARRIKTTWFLRKQRNECSSYLFGRIKGKWRSAVIAVMSLLALCASMLPSLAWAYSVTGRVGDAQMICRGMMPQTMSSSSQTIEPCARATLVEKSLSSIYSEWEENAEKPIPSVKFRSLTKE
jgi:hypothetical protein